MFGYKQSEILLDEVRRGAFQIAAIGSVINCDGKATDGRRNISLFNF
jgi:hypothetical protein